jgi:hypothetical protein
MSIIQLVFYQLASYIFLEHRFVGKRSALQDSSMKLLCCTGGGDEEVGGRGEGEASRVV